MGDFRVKCKIELNGKKYESNLNWIPYEINTDVITWLQDIWDKEVKRIINRMDKAVELEREKEEREVEKEI